MEDDDIFDAAVKREHGVAFGATPSPSSTTSDLAAASRISLPASANSSPPTSALKPLAPSALRTSQDHRWHLMINHHPSNTTKNTPKNIFLLLLPNGNGGAIPQRTSWHGSSGQTPDNDVERPAVPGCIKLERNSLIITVDSLTFVHRRTTIYGDRRCQQHLNLTVWA